MKNQDIRVFAKENGVYFWQIADVMGVSEPTMTRKLRHEMPDQDKQTMKRIIETLAAEQPAK